MRAVVQRVSRASVVVDGDVVGKIGDGFVVLVAVGDEDDDDDVTYLADKVAHLRVFSDDDGRMNRSLKDIDGGALVISQFTLFGDCRRGRRPSFMHAAPLELANTLYERFVAALSNHGVSVAKGVFQAHMELTLTNDGPVTILLDSKRIF